MKELLWGYFADERIEPFKATENDGPQKTISPVVAPANIALAHICQLPDLADLFARALSRVW
ncbi:MAG: hypothetical protein ACYS21_14045 [Planctomycetota bacterium]